MSLTKNSLTRGLKKKIFLTTHTTLGLVTIRTLTPKMIHSPSSRRDNREKRQARLRGTKRSRPKLRRLEVTTVNKKSSLKWSPSSLRSYLARDALRPRTTTLLSTHRWTRVRWPRASLKRARIPNQPILLSPLLRTPRTLMLARAKESNSTSILLSSPYLKEV